METGMRFLVELVSLIKEKPELASLDDDFVSDILCKESFVVDAKYVTFAQFKKSALCKKIVSQTRKRLRETYGVFIKQPLRQIAQMDAKTILLAHQSTFERFEHLELIYELVFDKLFARGLSKEFTLLDVACGHTPFSLSYFPVKPCKYIACDLSSEDMMFVQDFLSSQGQKGTAKAIDVLSDNFLSWVSSFSVDVCFLLKALDSFEQRKRNSSKQILSAITAQFFVVSFALQSIGGKTPIAAHKRTWFEKFCTKQGWSFETVQIPNEVFYLVQTA